MFSYRTPVNACRAHASQLQLLFLALCALFSSIAAELPLTLHPEVASALSSGRPVVALESTIISHGMAYPQNLQTAREVERIVRECGATPATIALIDGQCVVGLDDSQLELLAKCGRDALKCSRRDIAAAIAKRSVGATTVSATMLIARAARISVFVTGGVGGVHRGGENSMDVSADLVELSRTPVAVVCAGIKSILDIARTLEVLETHGVPVLTIGAREFPAFFTRESGCTSPLSVGSTEEAAAVVAAQLDTGLGGILLGVPIPEHAQAEAATVQAAIERALEEASAGGVGGRDVTPFVLKRVADLTQGASLAANIALVKHNAAVGAELACTLCRLRDTRQREQDAAAHAGGAAEGTRAATEGATAEGATASKGSAPGFDFALGERWRDQLNSAITGIGSLASFAKQQLPSVIPRSAQNSATAETSHSDASVGHSDELFRLAGRVVVAGSAAVDVVASPAASTSLVRGSSTPGRVQLSCGGVGRNVAEALARLRCPPLLLSAVGDDAMAQVIERHAASLRDPSAVETPLPLHAVRRVANARTATYAAFNTASNDLEVAVADMGVMAETTPEYVAQHEKALRSAPICVADANLPPQTLQWLCRYARSGGGGGGAGGGDGGGGGGGDGGGEGTGSHDKSGGMASALPIWLEPVSVPKARAACVALGGRLDGVTVTSPNEDEVLAMAAAVRELRPELAHEQQSDVASPGTTTTGTAEEEGSERQSEAEAQDSWEASTVRAVRAAAATLVKAGVRHVLVTRGAAGVLWAHSACEASASPAADGVTFDGVTFSEWPALPVALVDTRGAGDSFVAGTVWGLLQHAHAAAPSHKAGDVGAADDGAHGGVAGGVIGDKPSVGVRVDLGCDALRRALRAGLECARLTLQSDGAVSEALCHQALRDAILDDESRG